jgi:hypothetical protein
MDFFNTNVARTVLVGALVLALSPASAKIDWGGGLTQFLGENGEALTKETGAATLIAVSSGELIDFHDFIPDSPEDLLRVGAQLRQGTNVNRVIAETSFFLEGYLLYSAIPNLETDQLSAMGLAGGEALHLVVWDRMTFVDGLPTDESYFTTQRLYTDGDGGTPAEVSLDSDMLFAQVAHPTKDLLGDRTTRVAEKAGHNTFGSFMDWAQARLGLPASVDAGTARSLDSDGDGRSNFEEYVLSQSPRIQHAPVSTQDASATLAGEDSAEPEATSALRFFVDLRASDGLIAYTVHAATDLSNWLSADLHFSNGRWASSEPDLVITDATYAGEGVWSVAMQYQGTDVSDRCFYKLSFTESVQ